MCRGVRLCHSLSLSVLTICLSIYPSLVVSSIEHTNTHTQVGARKCCLFLYFDSSQKCPIRTVAPTLRTLSVSVDHEGLLFARIATLPLLLLLLHPNTYHPVSRCFVYLCPTCGRINSLQRLALRRQQSAAAAVVVAAFICVHENLSDALHWHGNAIQSSAVQFSRLNASHSDQILCCTS